MPILIRVICVLQAFCVSLFILSNSCAQAAQRGDSFIGTVILLSEQNIDVYEELGIKWVRLGSLPWGLIEKSPGDFNFDALDQLIVRLKEMDVRILITLRALSSWGSSHQPKKAEGFGYRSSSVPKDMEAYKRFLAAVVNRYKHYVKHWQIENEPNASAFWSSTEDDYIELLSAAYETIKQADPQSFVLSAGLACGISRKRIDKKAFNKGKEFFEKIVRSGKFDILDIHNYYLFDEAGEMAFTFSSYLEQYKSIMDMYGCHKPVWISEFGYSSKPIRNIFFDANKQALLLDKAVVTAREYGVEKIFWLKMQDSPEGIFSHMGLLEDDGGKKEAFYIFKDILNREIK